MTSSEQRTLEKIGIDPRRVKTRRRSKIRRIRKQRMARMHVDTATDETNLMRPSEDIVLGVYGTEDWVFSKILRDRFLAGESIVQLDGSFLTSADFNLVEFAKTLPMRHLFFGSNSALFLDEQNSILKIRYGRSKIEVEVYGTYDRAETYMKFFNENFRKAENLIEWVFNARGDTISVPLNFRPALRSAYPWIDASYSTIGEYVDEYMNSDASVLILIGAPGTGKTTFIKNLIHRSKADAKVAYDPKVMMEDGFFAGFIEDDSKFLIMEDADEFLQSRTDGNTMMHKFLNVSDGLISAADKKMVFSTNLPAVADIDSALIRPGRCFDVLQFRALTRAEAQAVLNESGSSASPPDGAEITLAELFSIPPSGRTYARSFVHRKIGF